MEERTERLGTAEGVWLWWGSGNNNSSSSNNHRKSISASPSSPAPAGPNSRSAAPVSVRQHDTSASSQIRETKKGEKKRNIVNHEGYLQVLHFSSTARKSNSEIN